jgi:transforming growth factor-beta-induced protein
MKRSIALLVPALAIAIAACSAAASPSAVPTAASTPSPAATAAAAPSAMPSASAAAMAKDIVQTATEAGSFKTLLAAVKAAGLVETLQGEGPFTVFAPTDAAFAALPAGTLDGLLKDPAALKKILLYHVVSGSVTADKVVGLTSATSVEGSPIAVSVKDGTVYLNDSAKVVTPDVMASNGVIHVIDKVILPPSN